MPKAWAFNRDRRKIVQSGALAIFSDDDHSKKERRHRGVGQTDEGRAVFIVFALRNRNSQTFIRPISARYVHQKEIKAHEEENPHL